MSEDESWRSDAAYDYIDKLTPGDLAWEFLRRNPDYRKSYRELVAIGRLTEDVAREFAEQWGLRFRRRSSTFGAYSAGLLDPGNRPRDASVHRRAKPCRKPPR
ncbi:transcriptional regulator domain-containing protein [Rhizobium oryzihabitans]|uniref:transcriptional regulator domain-containing protein n=1 Tax=Rhizobium oryzihabitans TaxID=2267833 RepID=UPI0040358711